MNIKLLVFTFLFLGASSSFASHIVGGIITYKYLGNNKYELTFQIYRDCLNSQTPFDGDPDNTGPNAGAFQYTVFDNATGTPVMVESINDIIKTKVSSAIVNDCNDTNQSCVEEGFYRDTITIPNPNKWYSIYHQRCCRNNGINNLKANAGGGPGGSNFPGMTIYTVIPPITTYSNNSAVFKNYPPIFLCKDQQFNFDHSATDPDGDTLKYYFVTPLDGGTATQPRPITATFTKVEAQWQAPYSLTNVLGGTINANIDENTGFLTCKPDVSGRFVVSIMVKEFRNGICIDSTIRDFQFNVNECDNPKSDLAVLPGTFDPATGMFDYAINCKDKTINFNNTSTNASKFVWNFGDPSSGIRDTSTLKDPVHVYSDTGVFVVTLVSYKTLTNNKVCVDTLRAYVRIFPTFYADFSFPTLPLICPGKEIQFTDKSTGTYGDAIKWDWVFGDGGLSTEKNPKHSFNSSGTFIVKLNVENKKKCRADTTISLIVNNKPNINATVPNACIGQSFKPECKTTVASPDVIAKTRWTLPGRTDTNCITFYTPPNMNSFQITLWAETNKGCNDSMIYNVVVNPLPTIKAIDDTFICYDSKIQLGATGSVKYAWTPANELDNPNIQNPIASPLYPNSSRYTVKGTDALGCYNFDSVLVSFRAKPFIDAGNDVDICLKPGPNHRDTVHLNGQGSFNTVFWTPTTGLSNPNIKNPVAKPTATTDYIFNGIDQFGCIVKDTVRVIVLDPSLDLFKKNDLTKCSYDTIILDPLDLGSITSYSWSPPIWIHPSDIQIRTPRVFSRDTTTYTLIVNNYCYSDTEDITINIIPSPKTNLPAKDSTCYGNEYQFNLNPINTYVWATTDPSISNKGVSNPKVNPVNNVWYYVTATNSFGCTVAEAMEMIVNYKPNVTVLGLPRFICLGDSAELKIIDNLKTWVRWTSSNYVSDSTSKEIYYFPPKTETLNLKVYTAWNCFTEKIYNIPVQRPIIPNVLSPIHMCKGKYVDLYASGGFYYHWSPYYELNDSLSDKPQVSPDSTMKYFVKISNDCFSDTVAVEVIVDSLPRITIIDDTSIYRGQEIDLSVITESSHQIEWFPKDKINSNPYENSIRIDPIDSTYYSVKAIDGNQCEGFDTALVTVYSKNVLLLPTGFTPNGDGINDWFGVIKHLNVKSLDYFEVYNRWGTRVFSTTDIDTKWDGTYKGEPCSLGSYSWQIQITNYDNEKITKSGSIDVLR